MIVILNFGGQTCHLIARRIRDLGVYAEILPHTTKAAELRQLKPEGIILSGGPDSVYDKRAPKLDPSILKLNIPILGICYGLQLIAKQSKGVVSTSQIKEFGKTRMQARTSALFKDIAGAQQVWMNHGDKIKNLPSAFKIIGSSSHCPIAAFENTKDKLYGVQFHPEVEHTVNGTRMLKNFVKNICKAKKSWTMDTIVTDTVNDLKRTIGKSGVIMGVSGGVDSTVAATLLHKAIGKQLHCVFIDHGLLRKNEKQQVKQYYTKKLKFHHAHFVDASKLFLRKLKGVTDPEQKRKVIGHTFIEVFEAEVKRLEKKYSSISFLGQGTIYPDRIESAAGSKTASKIKSHHNLTLPEKMKLTVVEPLKELYKDEVRALGRKLKISNELLERHPFPGPGLGIRILGELTPERIRITQEADHIFISELHRTGWYKKTWQAFAALFPIKSVGVMGDARTYEYIVSLRAICSTDAMTADWTRIPQDVLAHISSRIVNEVRGVNRVVFDITSKPPGTIEYE